METKYTVTGMTCQHCVNHVTEEVQGIDGVHGVSVQLDGGEMVVASDERIPFDAILEAVQEAGDYTVVEA